MTASRGHKSSRKPALHGERKRREEAHAHLAAIVASSRDGIIGHTLEGIITSWNHGAEMMFGYKESEVLGRSLSLIIPEHHAQQTLKKLKEAAPIDHFEVEGMRRNGRRIDVSLSVSPVLDSSGAVIAASTIAREFTQRKLAEDRKSVLMAELDHRVKNTLMVISSLISQTLKSAETPEALAQVLEGRIQALSRIHNLLNGHQHTHARLVDIVQGELAACCAGKQDRVLIRGSNEICLTPKATQALAMALHELATNALKFGALSTEKGYVQVSWVVSNDLPQSVLSLEWIERGGPTVTPPTRRGFGSQLIERIVSYELGANVDRQFAAGGVRCAIAFPLTEKNGRLIIA